jgi:hypothetical protein
MLVTVLMSQAMPGLPALTHTGTCQHTPTDCLQSEACQAGLHIAHRLVEVGHGKMCMFCPLARACAGSSS